MVGTLGVVNGSSKKQRVAKATLDVLSGTESREMASARRQLQRQIRKTYEGWHAGPDHETHYATAPGYRQWCDETYPEGF